MDGDQLEIFINREKRAEIPKCPETLELSVLRRARESQASPDSSAWEWLLGLMPRPGFVFASIAMVVIISSGISILSSPSSIAEPDRHFLAARALDFTVFQQTDLLYLEEK